MKKRTPLAPLSIFLLLSLLLLSNSACNKKIAPETLPADQIIFGNGGGFAGIEKTFVLLNDGQIFEKSLDGKVYERRACIGKKTAAKLFAECDSLKLSQRVFSEPDNLYQFMTIKTAGKVENRLSWGSPTKPVPDDIAAFFNKLNGHLPKAKRMVTN